jgi:predicted ATP-grasp superfamily ATP-dependent carboligase
MKVKKKAITSEQINLFKNNSTLYCCDFRAISESMDYKIPAMWKYENLLAWVLSDKNVVVNEDLNKLDLKNKNNEVVAKKTEDPRNSVFKRLSDVNLSNFKSVWTAIPHPHADEFTESNNLKLNYNFDDFLELNDKIKQKELLDNFTPEWKLVNKKELYKLINSEKEGFLKRSEGAGGFTVFDISNLDKTKVDELFSEFGNFDWYFEKQAKGRICSIQCLKEQGQITIFGFSEQIIEGGKYYCGSNIHRLNRLNGNTYKQLEKSLDQLIDLLSGYIGFFGVDFIIEQSGNVKVLEANIRLTAATIPTLLFNESRSNEAIFQEDVQENNSEPNDTILTFDAANNLVDLIKFS